MFPDFLGIGAQKSGTTWLYQNLAAHPQIWMPPVKELHYLDHKPKPLPVRLVSRKNFHRKASIHLRQKLIAPLKGEPAADLVGGVPVVGQREDAPRVLPADPDEIADAVHEDTGFARPGAGQHEHVGHLPVIGDDPRLGRIAQVLDDGPP